MKKLLQKQKNINEQGFTLIELMVSLSVFVIVVLASISSLYSVSNASRKVEAMRNVLDNLNFAVESMSRTIRTGYDLSCSGTPHTDCPLSSVGGSSISLKSTLGSADQDIAYTLSNGSIIKTINSSSPVNITSPEIQITKLRFFVDGASLTDAKQPSVAIFVEGIANAGTENTTPFAIQTYISQRRVE